MLAFFLNASNVVYLLSYVVEDILWLRVLNIVGGAFGAAYFVALGPKPEWNAIAWIGLFSAINAVQLVRLIRGQRAARAGEAGAVAPLRTTEA